MEAASIAHADATTTTTARRRRTAARASSPQLLGMLLFIISEIMVFGAFFTAYFFIRVVAERRSGSRSTGTSCRSPSPASTRRSCSPRRSRCTGRETSIKNGNRFGLKAGMLSTFLLGADVPLHPDQRVRPHRLRAARLRPGARSSTASPACTARTSSIGLTLLAMVDGARLPRPLLARGAPRRRGAGHLLALRRRHVDRRLHVGLRALSVLNPLRSEEEAFRALVCGGRRGGGDRRARARRAARSSDGPRCRASRAAAARRR